MLGVPLDFGIVLLDQVGDERQKPQVGQNDASAGCCYFPRKAAAAAGAVAAPEEGRWAPPGASGRRRPRSPLVDPARPAAIEPTSIWAINCASCWTKRPSCPRRTSSTRRSRFTTRSSSSTTCTSTALLKSGDLLRKLNESEGASPATRRLQRSTRPTVCCSRPCGVQLILEIDGDHTSTQKMLADLYAKKTGRAAAASSSFRSRRRRFPPKPPPTTLPVEEAVLVEEAPSRKSSPRFPCSPTCRRTPSSSSWSRCRCGGPSR